MTRRSEPTQGFVCKVLQRLHSFTSVSKRDVYKRQVQVLLAALGAILEALYWDVVRPGFAVMIARPVNRDGEGADGRTALGYPKFGVPGQIADKYADIHAVPRFLSVSYTHLAVYKRQAQSFGLL